MLGPLPALSSQSKCTLQLVLTNISDPTQISISVVDPDHQKVDFSLGTETAFTLSLTPQIAGVYSISAVYEGNSQPV